MVRFWTLIDLPRESNEITCKNIPGGEKNPLNNVAQGLSNKGGLHVGWGGEEAKGERVCKPVRIETTAFQGHHAVPASQVSETGAWESPGGNGQRAELGEV